MADPIAPTGKLDLTAVASFHEAMGAAAQRDVTLDLGKVTLIGALCLQSCIAAARASRAAGHDFHIVNVPDVVLGQMKLMGFSPEGIAEGAE